MTPLARLLNTNLREGLADGGRGTAGVVWRRLGANLVILELCTAVVLLSTAGLLGKSFYRLLHADLGMEPGHLAMLGLRSPHEGYEKDVQLVALAHRVREEAGRLPGVQSAAVARQVPVSNVNGGNSTFEIVGRPASGEGYEATDRTVGAGYFRTMGARLEQGRYFTEGDDASKPLVMIVNRTFALRFFPGEDPLGKLIRYDSSLPPMTVVGIVGDIREGPLDLEVSPVMYTPFDQGPDNSFYVVARVAQDPHALLATLDATVRAIDPRILTMSAETMDDRIGQTQSAYMHRASAWLTGGFAVLALVLGVIGLYGVIAYSVSQRTREIGVRMALGAERASVHRMVLREAGWLTAVGIAAGLVCSVGTAMLMRNLLFGTVPWDAEILGAVTVVLGLCAMLASYIPARRAALVNPVDALRAE
jgi:macrolide transport system ATP-binding/permease protein